MQHVNAIRVGGHSVMSAMLLHFIIKYETFRINEII